MTGPVLGIGAAPLACSDRRNRLTWHQSQSGAKAGGLTLDPRAVERWVDEQVEPALKTSGVPGAVVVVVQRKGVVLNKGYGLADVAAETPVNADVTLFQTASIGKTMTAIVTTQLLEEGVLDLDEDVNRYLKSAQVTRARSDDSDDSLCRPHQFKGAFYE